MSSDSGPDYRQQQEAQEREQQEAWEALEWWETHHICQSYGTQQGMTTAPDLESNYVQTSKREGTLGQREGFESDSF